jgi:hypothetical protein
MKESQFDKVMCSFEVHESLSRDCLMQKQSHSAMCIHRDNQSQELQRMKEFQFDKVTRIAEIRKGRSIDCLMKK